MSNSSDEPIHVVLVTTAYPPDMPSGVVCYLPRLAEALVRCGARVTVLTSAPGLGIADPSSTQFEVIRCGGELPRFDSSTERMKPCPYDLLQHAARIVARGGAVETSKTTVFNCQDVFSALPASLLAENADAPLVVTRHINPLATHSAEGWSSAERQNLEYFKATESWMMSRADAVMSVSPGITPDADRNGAPIDIVPPAGLSIKRTGGAAKRRPGMILLPGRLAAVKGSDVAIRALAMLPQEFTLVLTGDSPYKEELVQLVATLRQEHRVVFRGNVSEAEMASLYEEASVVIAPSRREAYGMTVAEALGAGCMVVGSDVGGISRQLTDGVNGLLVPPEDPDGLAAAILRAENDGPLRETCMSGALASWSAMRTWDDAAREALVVYRRALAAH
jgi:glycosyltransferase involved in cell wall biosynthesis